MKLKRMRLGISIGNLICYRLSMIGSLTTISSDLLSPVDGAHRLYMEQSTTTDGDCPNTLIIADYEVLKATVPATKNISVFNEETRSPFLKECKTLIHPGKVNRIRELSQNNNILATLTDDPDVFIWDVCAQPNRLSSPGVAESRPDVILTGHTENAPFALAMCHTEPFVLSAGQDKSVVLWSIEDCITSLGLKESGGKDNPKIYPCGLFEGHDATVEDVHFCPSSAHEFCSVGHDSCLVLWDARSGNAPVAKVWKAHDNDVHCVDWNAIDTNLILTGSADHTVLMFDRRILKADGVRSLIQKFESHEAPVMSIQWSPHTTSVFASAADDGILKIWDNHQVGKKKNARTMQEPSTSGLIFNHAGHRFGKIVFCIFFRNLELTTVTVSLNGPNNLTEHTLMDWFNLYRFWFCYPPIRTWYRNTRF